MSDLMSEICPVLHGFTLSGVVRMSLTLFVIHHYVTIVTIGGLI